jgi:hypothetical protein
MFDPAILITAALASLLLPVLAKLAPALGRKLLGFFFAAQLAELNAKFQRQLEEQTLTLRRELDIHKAALARQVAEDLERLKHDYARKLADDQADRQLQRDLAADQRRQAALAAARAHGCIVQTLQALDDADGGMRTARSPEFRRLGVLLSRLDHMLDEACCGDASLRLQHEAFVAVYDGSDLREPPVRQRLRTTLQRIDGRLKGALG